MTDTLPSPATDVAALPPAPELRRLTTRYIPLEDRLQLTGELSTGQVQILWLTRRLIDRILPHLWRWLEQAEASQPSGHDSPAAVSAARSDAGRTELQRFAQQAATAGLGPQTPVESPPDPATLLIVSVDLAQTTRGVRLTLKGQVLAGQGPEAVRLSLTALAMRQWLQIVYQQYRQAQWSVQGWPAWFQAQSSTTPQAVEDATPGKGTIWH